MASVADKLTAAGTLSNLRETGVSMPSLLGYVQASHNIADIDVVQSNIMSKIVFEIRGSLTPMLGSIDQLFDSGLNTEQSQSLNVLNHSVNDIMSVVNDLSDFSNLRTNKMDLDITSEDLDQIMQFCIAIAKSRDTQRNLSVSYEIKDNITQINTDIGMLKRVLIKLLLNAIKHTRNKIKIIACEDGKNHIKFTIEDNGYGIPPEERSMIFKKVDVNKKEGMGLSLIISKGIVELMGGKMWFDTDEDGTKFHFTIKLADYVDKYKSQLKGKHILAIFSSESARSCISGNLLPLGTIVCLCSSENEAKLYLQSHIHFDYILTQTDIKIPGTIQFNNSDLATQHSIVWKLLQHISQRLPSVTSEGPSIKILIADDNKTNVGTLQAFLKKIGHKNCDVAYDGQETINKIQELHSKGGKYDILFLDLVMPKLSGFDVMKKINKKYKRSRPYVIAVTADDMQSNKADCQKVKIDDFMVKPISLDKLSRAINTYDGK